jgi:8-oxo-dGTP pyrophosphatase MutT (NUDIX family)
MVSRESPSLSDLVPKGMFVGTSLILRQGDRFLYGARPPQMEGARQVVELTGIGGGMEDEDESPTAGMLREVEEEIGCDVRLLPCGETVIVRGPDRIERIALQGEEQPIVVIFRHFSTPPHQPWHESGRGEICVVIFLAELDGQPRPVAELELPALLWLRPAHILETARRDVPLRELLDSGAEVVEGGAGPLPEAAWARMTDSQEALALALGDGTVPFYEALAETSESEQNMGGQE